MSLTPGNVLDKLCRDFMETYETPQARWDMMSSMINYMAEWDIGMSTPIPDTVAKLSNWFSDTAHDMGKHDRLWNRLKSIAEEAETEDDLWEESLEELAMSLED